MSVKVNIARVEVVRVARRLHRLLVLERPPHAAISAPVKVALADLDAALKALDAAKSEEGTELATATASAIARLARDEIV